MAQKFMDAGQFVPDEIIIQMVFNRISQLDCVQQGWLLDGFPRTQAQAKALAKSDIHADLFLFLNVPDKELMIRVTGRRTDPITGTIYHATFFPPPPDIAGRLIERSDDTVDTMRKRLRQFHANVASVR
jgi:adenylate kinase